MKLTTLRAGVYDVVTVLAGIVVILGFLLGPATMAVFLVILFAQI